MNNNFTNNDFYHWYDPKFQEKFEKYDIQIYEL